MDGKLNMTYMEVGKYVIEEVCMLDKDTCIIVFFAEKDGDFTKQIEVEYWLDDDSWHFVVNYYDEVGDYVDHTICTVFNDKEVEKCKDIINEFLSLVNKN